MPVNLRRFTIRHWQVNLAARVQGDLARSAAKPTHVLICVWPRGCGPLLFTPITKCAILREGDSRKLFWTYGVAAFARAWTSVFKIMKICGCSNSNGQGFQLLQCWKSHNMAGFPQFLSNFPPIISLSDCNSFANSCKFIVPKNYRQPGLTRSLQFPRKPELQRT